MAAASETAYDRLKTMIRRGTLRAGGRIVERDLARQLGVSRIPLREGLARLQAEGLVRSVPNSATFVEDFAPEDVLEMYSMRLLLEPFAARLAAAKSKPSLVRELEGLCEQMTARVKKGAIRELNEADYKFHLAIVRGSGHKRLLRAYESTAIQVIGLRTAEASLLEQPPDVTAAEHRRIIAAVARRQPAAAEKAAANHVRKAIQAIERG